MLRRMVFTCESVSAAQLHEWGTVYRLTEPTCCWILPRSGRRDLEEAGTGCPAAKIALNEIDFYDLERNYASNRATPTS